MRHRQASAVAVLLAVSACACRQTPQPSVLPEQIVIFPGATAVRPESHRDGTVGVTYEIDMAFPAAPLLERLRAVFPADTWRALPNDWLNPGLPSSHTRGWGNFQDGTNTPTTEVHQWMAQWQDLHGDVVLYVLRYDSKAGANPSMLAAPDNARLHVTAVWNPAAVAEQLMNSAHGMPPKQRL